MKIRDLLEKNSVVISLDHDRKRRARLADSFARYRIPMPKRVPACSAADPKHNQRLTSILSKGHSFFTSTTELACAVSHISCIQHAYNKGWDYVVILEDDVVAGPFAAAVLGRDLPAEWDIVYLAHTPNHPLRNTASVVPSYHRRKPTHGWYHFDSDKDCAFGTYAYAVHRNAMKLILESYTFHVPLDYHLMRNHSKFRVYGAYPSLVYHDYRFGSYSNPSRSNAYSAFAYLKNASPLIHTAFTSLYSLAPISVKGAIVVTVFLLSYAVIVAVYRTRWMGALRRSEPNFPGIYGVDDYAPFCDLLSKGEEEARLTSLKALQWEKGMFVWRHTLLGLVRDGRPIPWEREVVVAKPVKVAVLNKPDSVRFIDYTEKDGWFYLADGHRILGFETHLKDGIGYPATPEHHIASLYGTDALATIRSPTRILDWTVPHEYRASIPIRDLEPSTADRKG